MKITAVCENTVYHKRYWAEEGLCILIEVNDPKELRILYDCGRSGKVVNHNFKELNQDLGKIDYLVLSHGHSGHVGGFADISKSVTRARIVCHPGIFLQKVKRTSNQMKTLVNQPCLEALISSFSVKECIEPVYLSDSIVVSGQVPLASGGNGSTDNKYFINTKNGIKTDLFEEELSLGIRTREGILILTSCAHRGILNIVPHVLSLFGATTLFGIIGGLHLRDDLPHTYRVIEELKQKDLKLISPCHCTGILSSALFHDAFPKEYRPFHTGDVITLK